MDLLTYLLTYPSRFLANVLCGQTAGWTKMPLGMKVGLSPGDFVFDGDPATPEKRHTHPTQFLARVYCGQVAGWIKMPLGTEVNVGSADVVRWGLSSPVKGAQPPDFGSCLLWPNGWMDEDATWYVSRPRPKPHCIRRGPSSPRKGHSSPLFSVHVYCGQGRLSQLLLSSCLQCNHSIEKGAIGAFLYTMAQL